MAAAADPDEFLLERYFRELEACFMLARGEQLFLLRKGYRPKSFNERGLHVFSEAYGRAQAIFGLIKLSPEQRELVDIHPLDIKNEAARYAYTEFRDEIVSGDTHDHHWEGLT